MVDTYAAARMELRGMPGALASLSETGQDAGTKLTDDEMGQYGAGAVGRQMAMRPLTQTPPPSRSGSGPRRRQSSTGNRRASMRPSDKYSGTTEQPMQPKPESKPRTVVLYYGARPRRATSR